MVTGSVQLFFFTFNSKNIWVLETIFERDFRYSVSVIQQTDYYYCFITIILRLGKIDFPSNNDRLLTDTSNILFTDIVFKNSTIRVKATHAAARYQRKMYLNITRIYIIIGFSTNILMIIITSSPNSIVGFILNFF